MAVVYTSAQEHEELTNGLLFCRVKSWLTGSRLVSLPFSDHCEPLVSGLPELRELFAAPQEELKNRIWKYLELRPRTPAFAERIEEQPQEYVLHTLDLRPALDTIYKNLHADSIRRKIRRAEREGLILESGNNQSLLTDFFRLHVATRRRHSLPPHPKVWFENLMNCFQDKAIIRIARKQNSAVAAVLTLENNKTAVYKYGCSDARFHNTGAMPCVFWSMIQDAKMRGFEQLDLGRTELGNQGLITFKNRWGATAARLIYARFPPRTAVVSALEDRLVRLAKLVFAHCPESLLTTAGSLLYPHIG
jgi:lipid II:glycine glycyltransferase (peptidoglycan interpeptide bridge formation enzyme)